MGREPKRISITLALEAFGADLCEALDVVGHRDEGADAFVKNCSGEGACGAIERSGVEPEAHSRDLAGSRAYRGVEGCFVVDDERFNVETEARVVFEEVEPLGAEHVRGHQRNTLPGSPDALLHRVSREECAQDDPEQLHDLQSNSAFCPAESARGFPTNFRA
jgi:hypothetical protein